MEITAYDLAQRFVGIKEVPGTTSNPQILAMLRLDNKWPTDDEVPWCSAFMNYVAWLLRLPRSKNLLARSWLTVGTPLDIANAEPGFDVVVLKRGGRNQPGPSNVTAKGHVGWYAGTIGGNLLLLGGNQDNSVSISEYSHTRLLGIRRLKPLE